MTVRPVGTVEIEPSIYASDFSRLGEQIEELIDAGAHMFHYDIGDGQFVEPITHGPIVLESIAPLIHARGATLDCHLMTVEPERHFAALTAAGGDSVTFHIEACDNPPGAVARARGLGLGVGLAVNPETPVENAIQAADGVDFVLCMCIHPGYSGQEFMPESVERIVALRAALPEDVLVQVDGGISADNVAEVHWAGADLIVAGTSIFGHGDVAHSYRELAAKLS